jgi:putative peptidoglycan lipid II flippase
MTQDGALSNQQIVRAALLVLFGFLASGVLGFVRVAIISQQFGTSATLDAFYAAQRIPEIIFTLVAGGALGSSFIPVYAKLREANSEQAWRLASAVMTLASSAAGLLGLFVAIFALPITEAFLLPGRDAETQALAATLTQMMMVTPFIFSISGLVMGILQSHGIFLLPSIAISMNNIGIIIGALLIAPAMGGTGIAIIDGNNVYGLAWGAILSAVLHLLVQMPGLFQLKARLRPLPDWRMDGVMDVLRLMLPRVLGLAVVQINFVVNIILASNMVEGSLVALNTAFMLMFFALGIIGQSVGSAVFPTLSALVAKDDWDGYKNRLANAMRSVLFLSLPATVVFIILGEPIVSLFERGAWTRESTQATAWALAFYATGIAGFALLEVLSRAFYALSDTWTPVIVGVGAMVSNIVLSLILVNFIGEAGNLARGPFAGLALANASTTLIEAGVLWVWLRRRIGAKGSTEGIDDSRIWASVWRVAVASMVMGVIMWGITQLHIAEGILLALIGGAVGGVVFFGIGYALNIEEARLIPRTILRKIIK